MSRVSVSWAPMSWAAILRLGVVNAALGAVVALVTFTLNRVMTVELAMPAIVPGALVALHYAVQLLRPRLGFGSDLGGRRTPWIVGGLGALSAGGFLAAFSVSVMAAHIWAGLALAVPAFALVGAGVGAGGTSSLTLMAVQVAPARRAAAATSFWLLMILGAVLTAGVSSHALHPFSLHALVRLAGCVTGGAFLLGTLAIWGVERGAAAQAITQAPRFARVLADVWREPASRRFAVFVFVSMLAYSAQELVLEPFAGAVLSLSPAQTAGLTGLHQAGVLAGMALVALGGMLGKASARAGRVRAMRGWTMGGCAGSAACLAGLACSGFVPGWPIRADVALLGVANGAFAVSAIGAMLGLAGQGCRAREGVRMGVWGAAQAVAMGCGGLLSTGCSDLARALLGSPGLAYAAVFLGQAALFLAAAMLAARVFRVEAAPGGGALGLAVAA